MPDTAFTQAPHWGWLIILYFFFGGLSAGSFVFAALLDLVGRPGDERLARIGYLVALPALALCPPLLILDLDRPERFWHMLVMDQRGAPILKIWSPMSIGSWALGIFGLFVTLAFLGALGWRPLAFLGRGVLRKAIAAAGTNPGFVVAGYTGVLLTVTNRPLWAETPLLGALFLLSAATTSAALLVWLGRRQGAAAPAAALVRVERWVALVELVALAALLLTLGPGLRVLRGAWGLALVAVVLLGIVTPLAVHARRPALGTALVLAGGLALRAVMILASEAA